MSTSSTPQIPQATPVVRQVVIGQEQLEDLFERAVANATAERATRPRSTKDLKLAKQKPFDGKPYKLEDFISESELIRSKSTRLNSSHVD